MIPGLGLRRAEIMIDIERAGAGWRIYRPKPNNNTTAEAYSTLKGSSTIRSPGRSRIRSKLGMDPAAERHWCTKKR